jgi:pimeloyl-ACP methyl ester carboxylesterase
MARRKVGWPLAEVLLHRFDNVSRLRELAAQPNPPQVVIIHGSGDQIIPVAMGRTLGAMPGVRYIEVEKGTHDMILDNSQKLIFSTMMSATLPPSGS